MRRILLLVSSMGAGGAERVAATLANAWASRGCDVRVLATYSGRGECFYSLRPGVAMLYLSDEVKGQPSVSKRYFMRLAALRRAIVSFHPDVIVSFLANVNVAAIIANAGRQTPLIISERIDPFVMPRVLSLRVMCRLAYRFADTLMVQTNVVANKFIQAGYPASKITVIPNPVSAEFLSVSPRRKLGGPYRLLSVGRLDYQKQIDVLLGIFAALSHDYPDWNLRIVGEGPQMGLLQSLIARYGLRKRVELTGPIAQIAKEYEQADIFVLTSRYEGFPNAMLEAMAIGLPCVAFDCPSGPRELSENGNVALIVASGDCCACENALRRLMSNPKLRDSLGLAAKRSVSARFAEDIVVDRWDDLFGQLGIGK